MSPLSQLSFSPTKLSYVEDGETRSRSMNSPTLPKKQTNWRPRKGQGYMTGLQEPGSEHLPAHHAHRFLTSTEMWLCRVFSECSSFILNTDYRKSFSKQKKSIHFLFPPMDWTEICPDKIRLMTTTVFNLRYPLLTAFVTQNKHLENRLLNE